MRAESPCVGCGSLERECLQVQPGIRILAEQLDERFDVRTVLCTHCGLVFTDPQPGESLLASFYGHQYRELFADLERIPGEGSRRDQLAWLRAHLGEPAGWRVLEIGCYDGYLLHLLGSLGARCRGVEPSGRASAFARQRFGVEVETARLEELELPDAQLDLVVLSHVAEHLRDPAAALRAARRALRPGGALFVEVPNVLAPRVEHAVNFFTFDHLFNFSPRTLGRLAERCGFETLRVDEDFPFPAFRLLARTRDPQAPPSPARDSEAVGECREAVLAYVAAREAYVARLRRRLGAPLERWRKTGARVAIYGAGDHSEQLLAISDLASANLVGFVDGDPAKQGGRFHGLPVCAPRELPALRADAVVVSSYDFQDEMREAVLRVCSPAPEILCLYDRVEAFSRYVPSGPGPALHA